MKYLLTALVLMVSVGLSGQSIETETDTTRYKNLHLYIQLTGGAEWRNQELAGNILFDNSSALPTTLMVSSALGMILENHNVQVQFHATSSFYQASINEPDVTGNIEITGTSADFLAGYRFQITERWFLTPLLGYAYSSDQYIVNHDSTALPVLPVTLSNATSSHFKATQKMWLGAMDIGIAIRSRVTKIIPQYIVLKPQIALPFGKTQWTYLNHGVSVGDANSNKRFSVNFSLRWEL